MKELQKPVWVKMKETELKKVIAELAETQPPSKVGIILRDQYGIPTTKIFGKKLGAYLKEIGINRKEDLENAEKKFNSLKEHLKKNITDRNAKHRIQKAQSRLNILKKYYSKKNK